MKGTDKTPSHIKIKEVLEFPTSKSVPDVRRFIGMNGWYRNCIGSEVSNALRGH